MRHFLSALLPAIWLASSPVLAGPEDSVVRLDVLEGWRKGDTHVAALEFTLQKNWKTYWRAPGEAGIPPIFDWSGSENLAGVAINWPVPSVFDLNGLASIGYKEHLILPLEISAVDPKRPISLRGRIDIGICEEICVPASLDVSVTLPAEAARRDPRIVSALANRPLSAQEAGVSAISCSLSPAPDSLQITARIELPPVGQRETVVLESSDPDLWVAPGVTRRDGGAITFETTVEHIGGKSFALDRSGLRLTVLGGKGAVDIRGCPSG